MTSAWAPFVSGWEEMLHAFKKDRSEPNPFEEPDTGRFASVFACAID